MSRLPILAVVVSLLVPACALRAPDGGRIVRHPGGGFRLELPAGWPAGAFDASTRRGASAGHPGAESTLSVDYLPLGLGLPRAPLVQVIVYPAERGTAPFHDPSGPGEVLVEASERIFVVVLPREAPYPAGSEDAARYASMKPSLADVRRGLVITRGED